MSSRNHILKIMIVSFVLLLTKPAFSHISEGTNTLMRLSKTKVSLIYTVPTDNIKELALGSDEAISNAIQNGFTFKNDQQICPVKLLGKKQLSNNEWTQFILNVSCTNRIKTLEIEYNLFLNNFDQHENKTRIAIGSRSQSFIFNKEKTRHEINLHALAKQWLKQKAAKK